MIETSKSQAEFRQRSNMGAPSECSGCNETPPSVKQHIVNLNEARKQWSAAGYKLVDKSERKRRYDICKSCDSLVKGQCLECSCFMRIKSLLAGMTCKLNKW